MNSAVSAHHRDSWISVAGDELGGILALTQASPIGPGIGKPALAQADALGSHAEKMIRRSISCVTGSSRSWSVRVSPETLR